MIEAKQFVDAARNLGFRRYTGVPCSFLTPFINYVIGDDGLDYYSAPNEGDAVAFAAGAALGGERAIAMLQNSGLGNAVSPLSSLNWTFRLPILLIVTWRGEPGLKDEPQHELMGQITAPILDTLQIPWEYFPDNNDDISGVLRRADQYMSTHQRPYALIMKKGSVAQEKLLDKKTVRERKSAAAPVDTSKAVLPEPRFRREVIADLIAKIQALPGKTVVLATTGFSGRELFAAGDQANQLYMVGSMGCISALGLGLSVVRPELRVVVLDGDGAALMRMGNFAFVGGYGAANLCHILLNNGVHDSTGSQETLAETVSFAGVADACGYDLVLDGDSSENLDLVLNHQRPGPGFLHIPIKAGAAADLPRPDVTPEQVKNRMMQYIAN